jgi:hypothetical protein
VLVCLCLGGAAQARADVVVDWNAIATQTAFAAAPPRPGPTAILDLAMVSVAMHDAIQAFEGRYESYAGAIPNATGSPVAAAAVAAHDVLVARFPAQAANVDMLLNNYLSARGLLGNAGVAIGQQASAHIIAARANDGSFPPNPEIFVGGTAPGEWRPTLPAFAPMASPWLGQVTPFTLKESTQLSASPPPTNLTSGAYVHDYNEVKALGSATSTTRTAAQTALALFYSDNFLVLWQRTLRGIASANITNNIGDSALLFALANMASADAIITAWADKRYWHFWRPITAIREGDNDGNPATVGDSTWLPYLATPPYPDYTSGANNLTGAMTRTLELFFGNKLTFTVTSTPANTSKTYARFSDMAEDVVNVRIYQGIHFRSADEVARRQGTRAADWAFSHFLRSQH